MIDDVIAETTERMRRAVAHVRDEFGGVRTGRASPALVEKLLVDYYGTEVPLQQLAGFTVPEARVLVIQPYDRNALSAIEKAIQGSDLGINPGNDGHLVRLVFPPLTAERRQDLVKVVRNMAEEARVAVRNHRRSGRHDLEALEKEGHVSADDLERAEKELEKVTAAQVSDIDVALAHKERELLET